MKYSNYLWTPQDVIARIKELCEEKNWTLNRLCEEADIAISTLYSIQSRNTFPSLETLNSVCSALEITFSYFFDFWCNGDKEQMLRIFATSGLYRPEKSADYYECTVIKALQGQAERYQPKQNIPPKPFGSGSDSGGKR